MTTTDWRKAMADVAKAPIKPEVLFVCDYCGTSRTSRSLRHDLRLKCDGCGLTTNHTLAGVRDEQGLVGWGRNEDWRENINRSIQHQLRTLLWLEGVYRQMGIEVDYRHIEDWKDGTKALYAVAHEVRAGQHVWRVEISTAATLDGRVRALRRAVSDMVSGELDYAKTGEYSEWSFRSKAYGDFPDERVTR
mgnify:CR=1 FL=1